MSVGGRSIVLVGFMGSGKSSAGKSLARKTRLRHSDTDEIIVRELGMPIVDIFSTFGEERFRDAETKTLQQLRREPPEIITTGGGIVLRAENVSLLRSLGTIINLEADEDTLFRRISLGP